MLQQTTVTAVGPYFAAFLAAFPTVEALAAAPVEEVLRRWAGLGYYARARNLHACARAVVDQHGGRFPDTEAGLRTLPGIGPYTAAAVAAIAFDQPAAAVDGNVERVIARLFALEAPLPAAKPEIRALAEQLVPAAPAGRFRAGADGSRRHDLHAARAGLRALPMDRGAARRGPPAPRRRFRAKSPKAARPLRRGAAFWLVRGGGEVLLRRRPQKGLLGGMAEVPGTAWQAGVRRGGGARRRAARGSVAPARRHGAPRLHPFRAGAGGVRRRGAGFDARARPAPGGSRSRTSSVPACRR